MFTLVLTEAEVDVIYDALRELSLGTDDVETLNLIYSVENKIYNDSVGNV